MYVIKLNPEIAAHLLIMEKLCKSIIYLPQIKLIYGKYDKIALYQDNKLITDDGNIIYDTFKLPGNELKTENFENSLISNLNTGKSLLDTIAAEQELDKLELNDNELAKKDVDRFIHDRLY